MRNEGIVNASVAAKEANAGIREAAGSLLNGDVEAPFDFLCECGCMGIVSLTLADYVAAGAWLDGHKPT